MSHSPPAASPQAAVTQSFEQQAADYLERYDPRTTAGHSFSVRKQRVLELLDQIRPGRVLDVGCGPGIVVQDLVDRGFDYYGVDIAEQMIAQARRRFPRVDPARFSVGRIQRLDVPDATFDVVLCIGVVEYVVDDGEAIREIARVLKPGGVAIISMPNRRAPFVTWNRAVYKPMVRAVKRLRGRPADELVHREYLEREYFALLHRNGLEPERAVYYNFKLIPSPFDRWLGRVTVWASRPLERLARGGFRWLGTGMLVFARAKGRGRT
jgi:ubiquinone/menaquinone biosynthesis C-methylase UbiE